jgi:hypothetical protein
MSIELDRLAHRRDPVARETATRTGAERARARTATALVPAPEDERSAAIGFEADVDLDAASEAETGIRLSLSAAALGIDPTTVGREPLGGRAVSSDDEIGPAGDESRPEAERRRVFDAYREAVPAPRGERIRVVV